VTEAPVTDAPSGTFLARNEFLIRRLHSLSGIIPVGAYMVVHLLTNSTINDSALAFQKNVYAIHSLPLLPLVEWVFIFIPLLFHGIFGVVIIRGGLPNNST
jgi:succinate dehydrogenase / fumarate reductase cytochrome b subunit